MSSAAPPPTAKAPAPAPAAATTKTKKTSKSKSRAKATKASGAGTTAKAKKPARKKKAPSKGSSAAATQATLAGARAAQHDIAKQKAQAAARRSDPLWYRIEDVLPTVREANAMTSASSSLLTEQVSIVENALNIHGLTRADVTPQAMACLLEQARRYAHELISSAQDYCYAANRGDFTREDFLLAAELRPDHPIAVSTQLPKLNLVAQQVNRAPLPAIPKQCYSGVLLPPKPHQLTARTYDIVSGAHVTQKMVRAAPEAPAAVSKKSSSSGGTSGTNNPPSYGAARGRQIPIKLKQQEKKGATGGTAASSSSKQSTTPTPMDISPSATTKAAGTPASSSTTMPPPAPAGGAGASGAAPGART